MLNDKDLKTLRLFNEKVDKLSEKGFIKNHKTFSTKIKWERDVGFTETSIDGPTDDEIESFALTLRFFCQDNEPCSLRNMSKIFQKIEGVADHKVRFDDARDKLNRYLDSEPQMRHSFNGKYVTNRNIFDTFMYGDLSHSMKKEEHDFWSKIPPMYITLKSEFIVISNVFYGILLFLKAVNEEVIADKSCVKTQQSV